jgi:type VI secretion system protein ImpL
MAKLLLIVGLVVAALAAFAAVWHSLSKKRKALSAAKAAPSAPPESEEVDLAFHEAEARLAAAKLQRGTRIADLPVFLLLGDLGAAKTSSLVQSGLEPELLSGQVYQNSDIAPTAGVNLWFALEAVFLEAGGRLPSQPEKWDRLLRKLVQRGLILHKGERAPRAAIVFYDCGNLIGAGAQEAATTAARNMRARLGEVSQALGIDLPVYVLFTKMDRVPFFPEYMANFGSDEAHQVFGETLPIHRDRGKGIYAEAATARLTESFNRLFRRLADGRTEFLSREVAPAKLPRTYEFPREFRKLRPAAAQFLLDLCRPSQLTVGPFLRGFYFTGTRSVAAEDAAAVGTAKLAELESVSYATQIFRREALAQLRPAATAEPESSGIRTVPQWMFLRRLFHDVVLRDRAVQGAGAVSVQTNAIRRFLLSAATLLCLLFSIAFTVSFWCNRGLEAQVLDARAGISSGESMGRGLAPADALHQLDTLRQSLAVLTGYRHGGAPWRYRWGLYTGDELYPDTRRLYFARFRQLLFGSTKNAILENLRTLPGVPGPEYGQTYDLLKAYLITTSNHEKSTRTFLAPVLVRSWSPPGSNVDPERKNLAELQFEFYASELKEANPFSDENDLAAIERARRYLAQFADVERVYALMLSEAAKHGSPINFNRQFPGSAAVVLETREVGAAFSKGGWSFMEGALRRPDRYFNGEKWVLGDHGAAQVDLGRLERDLQTRYYADFLREWRAYIQSASVVPYADAKDAAVKLRTLSSNQSPLLAVLSLASQHTAVDDPAVSAIFQPAQAVAPPGITDRYIAEPNQNYINALSSLQVSLENMTGQPDDPAVAQALSGALQAKIVTRRMSQGFRLDSEGHVDAAVQKLLEDPILFVEQTLRGAVPAELNASGKALCAQFRVLSTKFPFNSKSKTDATIADLNAVLRKPDGALWSFYEKDLKKVLAKQGNQYAASGTISLNPAFVSFFNTAAALSDTFYQPGAPEPAFSYTVKPGVSDGVQGITLRVDGQTLSYSVGSPIVEKKFTWQAAEPHDLTASVRVGGTDFEWQHQPGIWGIFRFLTEAKYWTAHSLEWPVGAGAQQFKSDGKPVTVRLEINIDPMTAAAHGGLTCVAEVAQ